MWARPLEGMKRSPTATSRISRLSSSIWKFSKTNQRASSLQQKPARTPGPGRLFSWEGCVPYFYRIIRYSMSLSKRRRRISRSKRSTHKIRERAERSMKMIFLISSDQTGSKKPIFNGLQLLVPFRTTTCALLVFLQGFRLLLRGSCAVNRA